MEKTYSRVYKKCVLGFYEWLIAEGGSSIIMDDGTEIDSFEGLCEFFGLSKDTVLQWDKDESLY